MKKIILIIIFVFATTFSYSQYLDLIITNNYDSIACNIDSITETSIYFEMKTPNKLVSTYISRELTISYELDIIDSNKVIFRPGTSYIERIETKDPEIKTSTLQNIPRNLIYAEYNILNLSINYEKMIPLSRRFGVALRAGVFAFDHYRVIGGLNIIFGGPRHFIEAGFTVPIIKPNGDYVYSLGYRYQSKTGITFKASPCIIGEYPLFQFSVGLPISTSSS